MGVRLFFLLIAAVVMTGCATTQTRTQNDQLASRVTDLEKNLQAKDAEIVDLQYQVKDLSSRFDAAKTGESDQAVSSDNEGEQKPELKVEETTAAQVIRVKASPERIQRALKAAGVYTGPIDGRIGAGTKEAIIEFQKSHGLKSDGVLGRRTWEELKKYLK